MVKNILFTLMLSAGVIFGSFAQTNSIFGVESEYTTTYGYRYFFDRLSTVDGSITQIQQLPVTGFSIQEGFFNCRGNFVFVATSDSIPYPVLEVDTLGNVINMFSLGTNSFAIAQVFVPAPDADKYYGLRILGSGGWELFEMDGSTGVINSLTTVPSNSILSSNKAIATNNGIYFTSYAGTTSYLHFIDPDVGVDQLIDSVDNANFVNLYYNCEKDTVFGFITNGTTSELSGAEIIKIDPSNNIVINTGTFVNGAGTQNWSSCSAMLSDGRYCVKTGGTSMSIFPATYAGSTLTPSPITIDGQDLKIYAAPRMSCPEYLVCSEETGGLNDLKSSAFNVYPNPVSGNQISINKIFEGTYAILNYDGKLVLNGQIKGDLIELNELLAPGIYFLYLTNDLYSETIRFVAN